MNKRVLCLLLTLTLLLPMFPPGTVMATGTRTEKRLFGNSVALHGSGQMVVEEQDADFGYRFRITLLGTVQGRVLSALYSEGGQLLQVEAHDAASQFSIAFETAESAGYAKFMWMDRSNRPVCESVCVELHADEPVIYSKPLEEEHIAEGELVYEGESVSTLYVDNEILLDVKDGVTKEQIERLARQYGGSVVGEIPVTGHYQIELSDALSAEKMNALTGELEKNGLIEDAYPNTVFTIEPASMSYYPSDKWDIASYVWNEGYPDGNNWGVEAINAPSAWRMLMEKYGATGGDDFPDKIPKV